MEKYQVQGGYMVGDRHSDVEAGKVNRLTVIGCQFGFADAVELKEADYLISQFDEILEIVK
jgi:phosphoglycolate phosphatase-like HAD superfamily hydrolase